MTANNKRDPYKWSNKVTTDMFRMADEGLSAEIIAERLTYEYGKGIKTKAVQRKLKERDKEDGNPRLAFIKYMSKGRTAEEVANRFHIPLEDAETRMKEGHTGYEVWPSTDEYGKPIYIFLPSCDDDIKISDRPWKLQTQPEGQPWLWVRFPYTKGWNEIRIVPLSDVHYGASAHLNDKFIEYVEWIKNNDNIFCFINGDLLENALGDSIGGAIYDSNVMPRMQIHDMIKTLAPIAHKILWALPGNHEDRTRKHTGIDPLEFICTKLNIPYINDAVHATVWWREHRWEFYAQHGATGSQTKGGKMNAAQKPAKFQEHIHFMIMGHAHDEVCNTVRVIVRDYREFKLKLEKQYVIVCPSFYGYFGTYASRKGYEPASHGAIACILYGDGKYRANAW